MTSSSKTFEVRRIQYDDPPLLIDFYHNFFQEKPKLNNHSLWRWEFLDNPYAGDQPAFFVIRSDIAIHGAVGAILSRVQVGSNIMDACHPVDFFVEDAYKGLPALRLFRKIMRLRPLFYASYVSDDAAKLFETAGFRNFNKHIKDYHIGLNAFRAPRMRIGYLRKLGLGLARKLLGLSIKTKFALFRRHRYAYRTENVLAKEMVPNQETQPLPERIGLVKDFNYLHWRYVRSPVLQCTFFSQMKDGFANILIIAHEIPDEKKVVILDVVRICDDVSETAWAVLKTLDYYAQRGYLVASTTLMSRHLNHVLRRLGFGVRPSTFRFMYYARDKQLQERLSNRAHWDFLLGDSDVY